ncbi:MAG TPA: MotA/TolQ/ExbB proton channel family protein [bacterium]|nr:MotA/TolQ/ExbB proton channel family protein [bacterium]HPQ66503.1 MotA/TolQ/ExbB proton channel family protein [bacterium]
MTSLLQQGGFLMYVILLCSVVGLAVFLEKLYHLHRAAIDPEPLLLRVRELVGEANTASALSLCRETPGPVAHIIAAGLSKAGLARPEIKEAIEDAGLREVSRLESRLGILATVAHISPLLGLLGTVLGMIRTFRTIENLDGLVNPSNLAGGIWEALLTTAFGLIVAIAAFVAYNFLVSRVEKMVGQMEVSAVEIADLLKTGV